METQESIKNDRKDDKLRWELLPLEDIEDIVKVYTEGAKKYGPNKWQDLEDGYNRYKAAAFRHILEYEKGNEYDEETGCRHLAQAAWNLIACLHISKNNRTANSDVEDDQITDFWKSYEESMWNKAAYDKSSIEEYNKIRNYYINRNKTKC